MILDRSGESIASPKRRFTLTNPGKSLTGTGPCNRAHASGRNFRCAPVSSGLDIVRKASGQHEIATLQTTWIDQAAQAVSPKTLLAHSWGSGSRRKHPATPHRGMWSFLCDFLFSVGASSRGGDVRRPLSSCHGGRVADDCRIVTSINHGALPL
jgi:hypothetical protein